MAIMGDMHVAPIILRHGAERKFYDPHIWRLLWITYSLTRFTLYTDRKDGSIFFFAIITTSQFSIILSKLIAIFFIALSALICKQRNVFLSSHCDGTLWL